MFFNKLTVQDLLDSLFWKGPENILEQAKPILPRISTTPLNYRAKIKLSSDSTHKTEGERALTIAW